MGRWKPPAKAATPYITRAGYRALEAEAKSLWDKRHIVVKHLAAAAAEGDRSENAEYIYRKKEMREIDRRIGYLQRRMPKLKVVDEAPADQDRVFSAPRWNSRTRTVAPAIITSSAVTNRVPSKARSASTRPWRRR